VKKESKTVNTNNKNNGINREAEAGKICLISNLVKNNDKNKIREKVNFLMP
jgi:hypothetical protein